MADVSSRRAYLTDLSDEQWAILERELPSAPGGGRKRTVDLREVVNAIYYRLFCREHEATLASSRADIHLAVNHLMLRRLTRPPEIQHQNENLLAHIA